MRNPIADYFKARRLYCDFVTHNAAYFEWWQNQVPGSERNFDTHTLFEVVAYNWRGEVNVARHYEGGVDLTDPRPQITHGWVHVRFIEKADYR